MSVKNVNGKEIEEIKKAHVCTVKFIFFHSKIQFSNFSLPELNVINYLLFLVLTIRNEIFTI